MNGDVWIGPNAVLASAREGYHYFKWNFKEIWDFITFRWEYGCSPENSSGFRKLVLGNITTGASELYRSIFLRYILDFKRNRKILKT